MNKQLFYGLLLATILLPLNLIAGPSLNCNVAKSPTMKEPTEAQLKDRRYMRFSKMWDASTAKQKFTVDLKTGLIEGDHQNYTNSTYPTVLEQGVNRGFYKTLLNSPYIDGPGSHIVYFVAELQYEGINKPFTLVSDADVYIGNCVFSD